MKKNIILIFILCFSLLLNTQVLSYTNSEDSFTNNISKTGSKNTNFSSGLNRIKKADKLYSKGKFQKAKKIYEDAIVYLLKANKENSLNADIIISLARSYDRSEKKDKAEIYYVLATEINPKNYYFNQLLGIFYVQTKKFDKANKRLTVMENCECKEYNILKNYIENNS